MSDFKYMTILFLLSVCSLAFVFVSGRNRKLQGLAASIVKLWEKCEIAKIAVKRGVQNTNSELMAEELKVSEILAILLSNSIVMYCASCWLDPSHAPYVQLKLSLL